MSSYFGPRQTSPVLDSLAARGALFVNAFSPAPWTLPAHASMLTGRYPSSLAPDPTDHRLFRAAPLLSSLLQRDGYATGAVTGGGWMSEKYGVSEGFDFFREQGEVEDAIAWLEGVGDRPFFLFFHTYAAHIPFRDRRYAAGMDGGRIQDIYPEEDWSVDQLALHMQVCCQGMELTASEKDFLLALYDGGIARGDEMVGRLLAALRQLDLEDETLVVVTSDHGEEFWEHTGRAAYHGHSLYDELLRVPLIWFDPKLEAQGGVAVAGRIVDYPVSLIDIVPTVIARLGVAAEIPLDGEDLHAVLTGDKGPPERILMGEGIHRDGIAPPPDRISARSTEAKLIVRRGARKSSGASAELYLHREPAERQNRALENPELLQDLFAGIEEHRSRATTREPPGEIPTPSAETREQLRRLGYVE
jgi:hypothetical protein